MSLLALRQADYDYAFTLLLASIIVTVALAGFEGQVNSQGLLFYSMGVTLSGPTSTTVNSQVQYIVIPKAFPSGFQWNNEPPKYTWVIYYNSSILVYNSQTGYVDGKYVSDVSAYPLMLSFTPTQVGMYTISYTTEYYGTVDNIPAVVIGTGGTVLQVDPPLSGWNWFANAVISAIKSFANTVIGGFLGAFSILGSLIVPALTYALQAPTISPPWDSLVKYIYNEILNTSIALSLLFIAGTVAYNALRENYIDLVDIVSDLLYKIGVWLLFAFGGLAIYNYVALFINGLINEIIYTVLPQLGAEFGVALGIWISIILAPNAIPFFGGSLKVLAGELAYLFLIVNAVITIRYFMILAIVVLIPLLATLWIFEWTRKIADALVDILIGLILAGLLNAIILTFIVAIGAGVALFLLPILLDASTVISMLITILMIKPHEHLSGLRGFRIRGRSGSQPPNQSPQNPPPSPPPQTVVIQPQSVIIQSQYGPYQKKPSGSPTTYI
jgi:hypothetical protein